MPIYRNTPVSERRAPLNLQYPVESYSDEAPFVVFRQIEARYDTQTRYQSASSDPYGTAATFNQNKLVRNVGSFLGSTTDLLGQFRDTIQGESTSTIARARRGELSSPISESSRNYLSRDNTRVTRQFPVPTDDVVSMYIPLGFEISDGFTWDTESTGLLGRAAESGLKGTLWKDTGNLTASGLSGSLNDPDISAIVSAHGEKALGLGAAGAGAALSKLGKNPVLKSLATGVSGLAGFGIGDILFKEVRKQSQSTINPRQFMLFNGPNIRKFNLTFNFVPVSETESTMVQNIIQWFREGAYPELSARNISYVFPSAFLIRFENINQSIPKIPEVILESISTQYNPTSMSYFYADGRPVEVNLTLNFSELQPIHKEMIRDGY